MTQDLWSPPGSSIFGKEAVWRYQGFKTPETQGLLRALLSRPPFSTLQQLKESPESQSCL